MTDELFGFYPFSRVVLIGAGLVVVGVAVVLIQMGARVWLHQARAQRLRDRVDAIEAGWREAA